MNPADPVPIAVDLGEMLARPCAPQSCKVCGKTALRLAGQVDFNRVDVFPPPFEAAGIAVEYWQCDACGRRRRGAPTRVVTNPHDGVVEVALCFMCVTVPGHDL